MCEIFLKGSITLKCFIRIPIKRNASSFHRLECNFSKNVESIFLVQWQKRFQCENEYKNEWTKLYCRKLFFFSKLYKLVLIIFNVILDFILYK